MDEDLDVGRLTALIVMGLLGIAVGVDLMAAVEGPKYLRFLGVVAIGVLAAGFGYRFARQIGSAALYLVIGLCLLGLGLVIWSLL